MKLQHDEQHVIATRGTLATARATISMNAHMFQMLAKMYSDPIRAIVRELAANALDAHVANGCPNTPFEVKLPTQMDPEFYIKDFGTGMSHNTVMELFMTYGASTKRSSNSEIGGFGIGSKSPYAYTDQYSMVVAYNGKQRTYGAYVDNNGIPTISMLEEKDASPTWPTGVQIRIPVRAEDFSVFKDRAQAVYQWFRVQPKVIGGATIQPIKFKEQHVGWARFDSTSGNSPTASYVSMGGITYLLDIGTHFHKHPLAGVLASNRYGLQSSPFLLEFGIGELKVTPSREALQYDAQTKQLIEARLTEIATWLGNQIADDIEDATSTLWTKRETVANKWRSVTGYNLRFADNVRKLLTHVKRDTPTIMKFVSDMWSDWVTIRWKECGLPSDGTMDPQIFTQVRKGVCKKKVLTALTDSLYIHPDKNFEIYYTDNATKHVHARIRDYLLSKPIDTQEVLWAKDLATAKSISRSLGDPGYKPVSSLPYTKPVYAAGSRPRKKGGAPLDIDQEVEWVDFTGKETKCKLKDVPPSARCWLVSSSERINGWCQYRTGRTSDGKGWETVSEDAVRATINAFRALNARKLLNGKYTGYIVVSAGWWAKNKKAEDLKWEFFMKIAGSLINVKAVETILMDVPPINMEVQTSFKNHGILAFIEAAYEHPDLKRVIEPVVKSTGLEDVYNQYKVWRSPKAMIASRAKAEVQNALSLMDQKGAINLDSKKLDFSVFYNTALSQFPFAQAFEHEELSMQLLKLKPEDAALRVKALLITEQELVQLNSLKDAA
jgi:hypothetical protein